MLYIVNSILVVVCKQEKNLYLYIYIWYTCITRLPLKKSREIEEDICILTHVEII